MNAGNILAAILATSAWNAMAGSGGTLQLQKGQDYVVPASGETWREVVFSGDATLSGGTLTVEGGGRIVTAAGHIVLGAPMQMVRGTGGSTVTVVGAADAVVDFSAPIGGDADIAFAGALNAGTYSFRADNTFTGDLYLTNALAYHVYADGAFGAAGGSRTFHVVHGVTAIMQYDSPLRFHGIRTSEHLVLEGNNSYALLFDEGDTVFDGPVDALAKAYDPTTTDTGRGGVQRWCFSPNATLTANGTVGNFNYLTLGGLDGKAKGYSITYNGGVRANQLCADLANGKTVINGQALTQNFYAYYSGARVDLNAANCIGSPAADFAPVAWNFRNTRQQLYLSADQQALALTCSNQVSLVTSTNGATLTLTQAQPTYFGGSFSGNVNVTVAGPSPVVLAGLSDTTGTVLLKDGANVRLTNGGRFARARAIRVGVGATLGRADAAATPLAPLVDLAGGRLSVPANETLRAELLRTNGVILAKGTYAATGPNAVGWIVGGGTVVVTQTAPPIPAHGNRPVAVHVSPATGDDMNVGSADAPVATLAAARDAVRGIRFANGGQIPEQGVEVVVADGIHSLREALALEAADSGDEGRPVVWRAATRGKAVLSGFLTPQWRAAADASALSLVPAEAQAHLLEADLPDEVPVAGFRGTWNTLPDDPPVVLTQDGEWLDQAHWPNAGGRGRLDTLVRIDEAGATVRIDEPRLAAWAREPSLWLQGFWDVEWADSRERVLAVDPVAQTVTFTTNQIFRSEGYGIRYGAKFIAFNALSEIDAPGEWAIDLARRKIFVWPLEGRGAPQLAVPSQLLNLNAVRQITLDGFVFEGAREDALQMDACDGVTVQASVFRSIGKNACMAQPCTNCRFLGCDAYGLGAGGFRMKGGNMLALTPSGNVVDNCHVRDYGRIVANYRPGIQMQGVGGRVTHNLVHGTDGQAVAHAGIDHYIGFNVCHDCCRRNADAGTIYCCDRDWTQRGTVIEYNFIHMTGYQPRPSHVRCVYLDDYSSGKTVRRNIFCRSVGGLYVGGGRDNLIEENISVNIPEAILIGSRGPEPGGQWAADDLKGFGSSIYKASLKDADVKTNALWQTRYGRKIVDLFESKDPVNEHNAYDNVISNNVAVCCGYGVKIDQAAAVPRTYAGGNVEYDEDPGFADYAHLDFSAKPGSPLWTKLGNTRFSEMGLYADPLRASPPVKVGADVTPPRPLGVEWEAQTVTVMASAPSTLPDGGVAATGCTNCAIASWSARTVNFSFGMAETDHWHPCHFSFVPTMSGDFTLYLSGGGTPLMTAYDDLSVRGASVADPDFEQGAPSWTRYARYDLTDAPLTGLIRAEFSGMSSASGATLGLGSGNHRLSQTIHVTNGVPVEVSFRARAFELPPKLRTPPTGAMHWFVATPRSWDSTYGWTGPDGGRAIRADDFAALDFNGGDLTVTSAADAAVRGLFLRNLGPGTTTLLVKKSAFEVCGHTTKSDIVHVGAGGCLEAVDATVTIKDRGNDNCGISNVSPLDLDGGELLFRGTSRLVNYGLPSPEYAGTGNLNGRFRFGTGTTVFEDDAVFTTDYAKGGKQQNVFYHHIEPKRAGETAKIVFRGKSRPSFPSAPWNLIMGGNGGGRAVLEFDTDFDGTINNLWNQAYVGTTSGHAEILIRRGHLSFGTYDIFHIASCGSDSSSGSTSQLAITGRVEIASGASLLVHGHQPLTTSFGGMGVGQGVALRQARGRSLLHGELAIAGDYKQEFGNFLVGLGPCADGEVVQTDGTAHVVDGAYAETEPIGEVAIAAFGGTGRYELRGGLFSTKRTVYVGGATTNDLHRPHANGGFLTAQHDARGTLAVRGGQFETTKTIVLGADGTGVLELSGAGVVRAPRLVVSNTVGQAASSLRFVADAAGRCGTLDSATQLAFAPGAKLVVDMTAHPQSASALPVLTLDMPPEGREFLQVELTGAPRVSRLRWTDDGRQLLYDAERNDPDTLALYGFMDGADGAPVAGTTVANRIDAAVFPGDTVKLGAKGGALTFSSEGPGRFVYSGEAATIPFLTNPGSVRFDLANSKAEDVGARLLFRDIGSALATNADYTVEFFWKNELPIAPNETGFYMMHVTVGDESAGDSSRTHGVGFYCKEASRQACCRATEQGTWDSTPNRNYFIEGKSAAEVLNDGLWHHVAQVHDGQTGRITTYFDYTVSGTDTKWPISNGTPTQASLPLVLGGRDRDVFRARESFQGKIACLRVTRKRLSREHFLYALDAADGATPARPETVFHWRFEGLPTGAELGTHAIPNCASRTEHEVFRELWGGNTFYFNREYYKLAADGNGVASAAQDYPLLPVVTDNTIASLVFDGDRRIGRNRRSARLEPYVSGTGTNRFQAEWAFTTSPSFSQDDELAARVRGDFTFEGFARFDAIAWTNSQQHALSGRAPIQRNALFSLYGDKLDMSTTWALLVNPYAETLYLQYGTNTVDQTLGTRSVFVAHSPKQKLASFTSDPYWCGNWHHYAVVYSEAAHTFKVYYDSRLYFEVAFEGELAYGTTKEYYKVGSGGNACEWPGAFDEVRLTRRALEPSEFLRQADPSVLFLR